MRLCNTDPPQAVINLTRTFSGFVHIKETLAAFVVSERLLKPAAACKEISGLNSFLLLSLLSQRGVITFQAVIISKTKKDPSLRGPAVFDVAVSLSAALTQRDFNFYKASFIWGAVCYIWFGTAHSLMKPDSCAEAWTGDVFATCDACSLLFMVQRLFFLLKLGDFMLIWYSPPQDQLDVI